MNIETLRNEKYIVVSHESYNDAYLRTFETLEEAENFMNTKEYGFRTRELYDMTNPSGALSFVDNWTMLYGDEEDGNGCWWDDGLELFVIPSLRLR